MKHVHIVEKNGKFLLFAPFKGLVMEIDEKEKNSLLNLINIESSSFDDILNLLPIIDAEKLLNNDFEIKQEIETEFLPTSGTIFPTLDCGLRCTYCYSNAGTEGNKTNMPWEIAKATIDFLINNAKLKNEKECSLEFHGGGEPTKNWPVFKKTILYFQDQSKENGINYNIDLVTNGMLSENQIKWLSNHINYVQISSDGMKEIQDIQRPLANGSPSSELVHKAIHSFLDKGVGVAVQCTITDMGINKIPEIVSFFINTFSGVEIHLEPACSCGRGSDQEFPSSVAFIYGFIEASKIASFSNTDLFYSGYSPDLLEIRNNFCGIYGPNFIVSPTGLVTTCHEVIERSSPLASLFIYGKFELGKGFIFDHQMIQNLRSKDGKLNPICSECPAQYYCVGDCLARKTNSSGKEISNPRCHINYELTVHRLFEEIS